ncbi:hypothetical protein KY314_05020 [Candidatus Woesearchaeota archaeon]|nr:hypothetical protein [Candidatus Woesearchaeota archaeon]
MIGDEEIKIMREYDDQIIKEAQEQDEKDKLVIDEAKKYLSKKAQIFIEEYFEESGGNNFSFKIVNEPTGNKQEEWDGFFVWVDQWRDGGYTGDDFAGYCYFKLNNGKYLKWEYEC